MSSVRVTGVAKERPSRTHFYLLTAPWFLPPSVKSLWSLVSKLDEGHEGQAPSGRARLGDTVEVLVRATNSTHTLTLCRPGEARPQRGRISVYSPLGLALLGAAVGEDVKAKTLFVEQHMRVLNIHQGSLSAEAT